MNYLHRNNLKWIVQKMKYNTVPDHAYTAINKEIDRYSSSLFMCSSRLLVAINCSFPLIFQIVVEWMDTGIEGILTFVTCRKLKSNVLRIYDETVITLFQHYYYRQRVFYLNLSYMRELGIQSLLGRNSL